jgi:hypothetical protein
VNKFKVFLSTKIVFTVIVNLSIIIATFSFMINENWHESTKGASPGIISNYIGAAITKMQFGRTGYVGYKEIRNAIRDSGSVIDNNAIEKAMAISNPSTNDIYTMLSLDAGYVDYCRLSFYFFGTKVGSLLYLYMSIFCISIVLFFIQFRNFPLANIILMLFLIAHYITITAIPFLDYNVGVIYNPRLIPMLGILPLIHICLSIRKNDNGISAFMAILLQSLTIIMVFHIRSIVLWMILFVFAFLLLNVASYLYKSFRETTGFNLLKTLKNNLVTKLISKSWPLTPVLIMFLVYKSVFPLALDPEYAKRGEVGSHSFWSGIFLGLALHPEIREKYVGERKGHEPELYAKKMCSDERGERGKTLSPKLRKWLCDNPALLKWLIKLKYAYTYQGNDQDGYSAAFNWLRKNGMSEHQIFHFDSEESVNYKDVFTWFKTNMSKSGTNISEFEIDTYRKFEWEDDWNSGEYEKVHYNLLLDVVRTHPLQVFESIFMLKPFQYIVIYANFFFLKMLSFPAIIMFCFAVFSIYLGKNISRDDIRHALIFFSLMFLFSVSPLIVTYPGSHVMFDQMILLHMIFMGIIVIILRIIYCKLFGQFVKKGKMKNTVCVNESETHTS